MATITRAGAPMLRVPAAGRTLGPGGARAVARPSPAVARRRRMVLVAAVLVTMLTCMALVGASYGAGHPGRAGQLGRAGPSITRAGALDAAPAGVRLYVVKPGDTLWGIATSLAGNGDPRPIMDRLARQVPTGVLVVGERLALS